jgi:hypothetical protein
MLPPNISSAWSGTIGELDVVSWTAIALREKCCVTMVARPLRRRPKNSKAFADRLICLPHHRLSCGQVRDRDQLGGVTAPRRATLSNGSPYMTDPMPAA